MRFALALLNMSLLGMTLLAQPKPAQQKPKFEITEVRATGCVRAAAEKDCLLLETLDGKTVYSFTATPKPDLDTVITIQGKSHPGRNSCKQGIMIDIVDWQPAEQMCAPAGKK